MKKLILSSLIMTIFTTTSNIASPVNPFFKNYSTPFQIPPFEEITMEHYKPGFEQGMQEHLDEINDITDNKDAATFENTIVALERTGETLDKVSDVFFNLLSSNTNDQMDSLAQEISPKLSSHRDSILLNKDLYRRVKSVYDSRNTQNLNPEQTRLIEETHKYFVRAGIQLDEQSMERLKQINQQLSSLSVQFDQNLLIETNEGFVLIIEDQDQLHGLPKDVIDQASALAESEDHPGIWLFKPTRASMYPFLT